VPAEMVAFVTVAVQVPAAPVPAIVLGVVVVKL